MSPKGITVILLAATLGAAAGSAQQIVDVDVVSNRLRMTVSAFPTNALLDFFSTPALTASTGGWTLAAGYEPTTGSTALVKSFALAPDQTTGFFTSANPGLDTNDNGLSDARERLLTLYDLPATNRARWARSGATPIAAYTNILNVKSLGAVGDGTNDDASVLATIIAGAPSGSVVYLPAGVYRVTQTLYLKSFMILRGDGPSLTRLNFEGSGSANRCIAIARWDSQQTNPLLSLARNANQGSNGVDLVSVSGLCTGDVVEIAMDNDPAWNLNDSSQQRLAGQIGRIQAIDATANRVVLERPLRHGFQTNRTATLRQLAIINDVGVENLAIERKDAVSSYTIEMKYAVNCWVRKVYSYKTYKGHVWMERSQACTVRDSYFHDAHVFGNNTQGYGVACAWHSSDILVENNLFNHLRHAMIVEFGANGNVYGYNFSTNRVPDPDFGEPQADLSVHGNYVFMNLFEGNILEDADVPDWYWPAGPGNTLFRNRILNAGTAIDVGSDRQNIVGNELPAGTIGISNGISAIVMHGNVTNGVVSWAPGNCTNLADSFYRSIPPDFFPQGSTTMPWPPIGPERMGRSATIPARERFDTGDFFGGL